MESKESIDLNLSRYLLAVKRHWIPALTIFTSTVALGIFAAASLKPSYQAEGRLLFKNPSFKVVGTNLTSNMNEGGESGELKPLVATQNPITTQLEVITSRPLLQKTVERLQLKNSQGRLLVGQEIASGISAKIVGGADVVQIVYKGRNAEEAAKIVNTLMSVYLENDILTSRAEAESARQFMDKQLPQTQAAVTEAETALRNFKQKNNVVDLAEESKAAVGLIGTLETAIGTARSQLEEIEAQRQELQKKVNLNSQDALAVSAIGQAPAVQGVLLQLQDVERQLATESSRFSANNPIVISLKEKQTKLNTLLQQQIRNTIGDRQQVPQGLLRVGDLKQGLIKDLLQSEIQRNGLAKRIDSLQKSLANYQKRTISIPQLVQTQRQLERTLEVSQSTNQNLSKKVQELQLAKTRNTSNARIIANASVPDRPDTSNRMLITTLGALAGALLGTSAIAYLEIKDRSLKTVKEIDKIFGYTLLGVIPASKKRKNRAKNHQPELTTLEIAVRDTPQSLTSEMSRTIQSNLRFLNEERSLNIITITSSVANEGKSKVAANLAAAIAGLGQRVLLIDADLRVPTQHRLWKLPLKKGLSELIANKSKLQQSSWTVMENLDVLPAGTKPLNPLSSLESVQMKSLLREVADLYDLVIIDAPPILVASDAITVGKMTDGILLVSRPGVIDGVNAKAAKAQLTRSHACVLGSIVNGVMQNYETEDYFSAAQDYFSSEPEADTPWTDYMTQLGETIADRTRQDSGFAETQVSTMLNKTDG